MQRSANMPRRAAGLVTCAVLAAGAGSVAQAQAPQGGPPVVGVMSVGERPVTGSVQYVGRIQAIDRVALVPRVTAFLDKRLFDEGSEVKKGDLLYVLEQGPFQAQVLAQQGALAQADATVHNAKVNFQRQVALLSTPAGQKQNYDNAQANAQGGAANVLTAQGNLQAAQIQLSYTEIRSPVDGRITSTAVEIGNVVSPSSGTLATIVTQDPMYVVFPAATRDVLSLQKKYESSGGLGQAAIKLELGDGSTYDQDGKLDYVSPTVALQTDTITLRATVANPKRGGGGAAGVSSRELVDGEFVTVTVADPHPVKQMVVPRAAVLSDQQGDYAFTVDAKHLARRVDVKLGETTGTDVVVLTGLKPGQQIIVDGIQRVHVGGAVTPAAPQSKGADPDATKGTGQGSGGAVQGGTPGATPAGAKAVGDQAASQGGAAPASNAAPSQR